MEKSDQLRLQHMLEAAQEALEFAHDATREDLETNRMLAHALVGCLSLVGEAARQVSPETREKHPAIPWQDIIGMRNRLVHAYYDINYDVVWQTVKEDLPSLVETLEQQEL
ncbi:MAG: DUF86 domain-containing protein [Chloroflexota bacterium]|nr:DUF86 domain-containing protein [Chloroflexota bacterium]MDE2840651.1 DUF86 domain-containing protein [Chloroflexota bacterium]MDE2931993.1 DUF86 domain-containing protein [Chloroflexota bacterium]